MTEEDSGFSQEFASALGLPSVHELLLGNLFMDAESVLSILERVAPIRRIVSTFASDEAPFSTAAVAADPNSTASNVDIVTITPPVGYIGIALAQYCSVENSGVIFTAIKDDNIIVQVTTPQVRWFRPLPDVWLPFRKNYQYKFDNRNTTSAAPGSHGEADIVYIPNDIWKSIETLFFKLMAPITGSYQASRYQQGYG